MVGRRVRKGVSLGAGTVASLEKIVADGQASSLSAAIDLVVDEFRRRQLDADLVNATLGRDTSTEAKEPGVLRRSDDRLSDGPSWTSLDP